MHGHMNVKFELCPLSAVSWDIIRYHCSVAVLQAYQYDLFLYIMFYLYVFINFEWFGVIYLYMLGKKISGI